MTTKTTKEAAAAARRDTILQSARWCFLNFGFAKTSLDDIARRAAISRTLLYKTFKDKEDIFTAVFADWLVSRQPAALEAAHGSRSRIERMRTVCRLLVLDPWNDMVGAPMAAEFHSACDRLAPEISNDHRRVVVDCVTAILGDALSADVFVLALDGQLADDPSPAVLEQRVERLSERFVRAADQQALSP